MPKRPPSLSQRLRDAWSHASRTGTPVAGEVAPRPSTEARGTEFADRLRAAVSARH
jgi:hypothetical protein